MLPNYTEGMVPVIIADYFYNLEGMHVCTVRTVIVNSDKIDRLIEENEKLTYELQCYRTRPEKLEKVTCEHGLRINYLKRKIHSEQEQMDKRIKSENVHIATNLTLIQEDIDSLKEKMLKLQLGKL